MTTVKAKDQPPDVAMLRTLQDCIDRLKVAPQTTSVRVTLSVLLRRVGADPNQDADTKIDGTGPTYRQACDSALYLKHEGYRDNT